MNIRGKDINPKFVIMDIPEDRLTKEDKPLFCRMKKRRFSKNSRTKRLDPWLKQR